MRASTVLEGRHGPKTSPCRKSLAVLILDTRKINSFSMFFQVQCIAAKRLVTSNLGKAWYCRGSDASHIHSSFDHASFCGSLDSLPQSFWHCRLQASSDFLVASTSVWAYSQPCIAKLSSVCGAEATIAICHTQHTRHCPQLLAHSEGTRHKALDFTWFTIFLTLFYYLF